MASHHNGSPIAHADSGIDVAARVHNRRTPSKNREGTVNAMTTRSIIAAAGLAAIGLAAWPPMTQQGVPTVHRDVALVDVTDSTLLTDEGTLDTTLWNDVLGPTGAEEQLYNALGSNAATLLDTDGASPAYSGDFDGAESRLFDGVYLDTLASEDELNQALGVSASASETAILNDWTSLPEAPLPTGDTLPTVGASGFDTDLTTIANGEYTLAIGDLEGYLASFATDSSGLSSLGTVFTDLGSSFSDLSNLSGDLTTILGDLGGLGSLGDLGTGDLGSLGTDLTAVLDGLTGLL
jgi:hypothetical protein